MRQTPGQADSPKERQTVEPEPEQFAGDNNPYRGIQDHGVPTKLRPMLIPDYSDEKMGYVYLPTDKELDPVPVRIVTESSRELRKWRAGTSSTDVGVVTQLVGRNERRTRVVITNVDDANDLYVSHEQSLCNSTFAFAISPNSSETFFTVDPIWASGASNTSTIRFYEEYTVQA